MKRTLLVFVLFLAWAPHAQATSYDVSATVPADPPTVAPAINNIISGAQVATSSNVVSGSCEVRTPPAIVSIWRAGLPIGSVLCQLDGTFTLSVSLVEGENILTPRSSSFTGQFGPDGMPATIIYNVPSSIVKPVSPAQPRLPSATVQSSNTNAAPSTRVPVLSSDSASYFYVPNNVVRISIAVQQGEAPYRVRFDWGDGTIADRTVEAPGTVVFEHIYRTAGQYQVSVAVTDVRGIVSTIHLAAVAITADILRPAVTRSAAHVRNTSWIPWAILLLLLMTVAIFLHYDKTHRLAVKKKARR